MGWRFVVLVAFAWSCGWSQNGPGEADQINQWMWSAKRLHEQGRTDEARALVEKTLKLVRRTAGNERTEALVLNNLGLMERHAGNYGKAERHLRRAAGLLEKFSPEEHAYLAVSLNNLSLVYSDQNQPGRAERHQRRALAILERTENRSRFDEATTLNALGVSLLQQQRLTEGTALLERAMQAWNRIPDDREVERSRATCRLNLAAAHSATGRWKEAAREQASAVATLERLTQPGDPELIKALVMQGQILAGAGELPAAEGSLRRAADLARTHLTENALLRGRALGCYARVLQLLGRKQEAKAVSSAAREALSLAERSALTRNSVDYSDLMREAGRH